MLSSLPLGRTTRAIHMRVLQSVLLATSISQTDTQTLSRTHTDLPQDQGTRLLPTELAVRLAPYRSRSFSAVRKRDGPRLALPPAIVPAGGFAEELLSQYRRSSV